MEIQFHAWKQSLGIKAALNRRSNTHHIHAAMIFHQLGMKMANAMEARKGRECLSCERLYGIFSQDLAKRSDFGELIHFNPYPSHIERDKRNRKSPVEPGILTLA